MECLQRSDPAPFYLFDEIDANLDATYRSRVADLVRRQANSSMNPAQVGLHLLVSCLGLLTPRPPSLLDVSLPSLTIAVHYHHIPPGIAECGGHNLWCEIEGTQCKWRLTMAAEPLLFMCCCHIWLLSPSLASDKRGVAHVHGRGQRIHYAGGNI